MALVVILYGFISIIVMIPKASSAKHMYVIPFFVT